MNSEKEVNDSINFTSKDNEFTGQFKIVKDEVPTNIDDIFVSKSDFDDINELIPNDASSSNQLADRKFVTDSISTNSATFKGTFNSYSELPVEDVDNNDYAFVNENNQIYTKYKFNGTEWLKEYTFNNTPFSDNQWDAINSGITSTTLDDYAKKTDIPAKTSDLTNDSAFITLDDVRQAMSGEIECDTIEADEITVNGTNVSLEGHKHEASDINGLPTNVSSFTNDAGYIKIDDLKTIAQQTIDELNQATTIDGKFNSILSLLTSIIELSNTGTKQ